MRCSISCFFLFWTGAPHRKSKDGQDIQLNSFCLLTFFYNNWFQWRDKKMLSSYVILPWNSWFCTITNQWLFKRATWQKGITCEGVSTESFWISHLITLKSTLLPTKTISQLTSIKFWASRIIYFVFRQSFKADNHVNFSNSGDKNKLDKCYSNSSLSTLMI